MCLVGVFEVISSLATLGALLAAIWQLRQAVLAGRVRDEERRVERALVLYEQVVSEGATYEAFHRLSVLLRRLGTAEHGITTWHVVSDEDLNEGGVLDAGDQSREQAFADLYAVLWWFERCLTALDRHLISEDVLMETAGFHLWWWGQMLRELHGPKATRAVRDLGANADAWAQRRGVLDDWRRRCGTDFKGGPAVPLRATATANAHPTTP